MKMKITSSIFALAVSLTAMIPVEQAEGSLIPYDFARMLLRTEKNQPQDITKSRASLEETANSNKGKKHHLAFLLLDDSQHHSKDHQRKDEETRGKGHKEHDLEGDVIPSKPVIVPQKYRGHRLHSQHGAKGHHDDAQGHSGSRKLQGFDEAVFEGFPRNHRGQKMLIGVPDEHGIVFPGVNGGRRRGRPSRLAIRDHGPHSILRKIPVHSEEDLDFRVPSIAPESGSDEENFHLTVYKADKNGKVRKVYDSTESTPQQRKERKEEIAAWMNEMRRQQEAMDTMFKELLTAPRLRGGGFHFPSIDWDELDERIERGADPFSGNIADEGQVEDGNEGSANTDKSTDAGEGQVEDGNDKSTDEAAAKNDVKDGNEQSGDSKSTSNDADDSNVSSKGADSHDADDSSVRSKRADSGDSSAVIVGVAGAVVTVVAIAALVVVKVRKQRQVEQTVDVPADDHYVDLERTSSAFTPQPPQHTACISQQDRYVRLQ